MFHVKHIFIFEGLMDLYLSLWACSEVVERNGLQNRIIIAGSNPVMFFREYKYTQVIQKSVYLLTYPTHYSIMTE